MPPLKILSSSALKAEKNIAAVISDPSYPGEYQDFVCNHNVYDLFLHLLTCISAERIVVGQSNSVQ